MRPFQYIATIQHKTISEQIDLVRAQFHISKKEAREYVQAYWMKALAVEHRTRTLTP